PGGAQVGDFATVMNMKNGKIVHAIFADSGPGDKIGEGSLALIKALGGKSENDDLDLVTVVYPGTKKSPAWPVSAATINAEGNVRFAAFGGANKVRALFPGNS